MPKGQQRSNKEKKKPKQNKDKKAGGAPVSPTISAFQKVDQDKSARGGKK